MRQSEQHHAALETARIEVVRFEAALYVTLDQLSTDQSALVAVKAERNAYRGGRDADSKRHPDVKSLVGDFCRSMVDHSTLIDLGCDLVHHDFFLDLDASLLLMFSTAGNAVLRFFREQCRVL